MKPTTKQKRIEQLIGEIRTHPHQQELMQLVRAQMLDDTSVYVQSHSTELNNVA